MGNLKGDTQLCAGKYFDLYDADKIKLPPYKADDLADLPPKVCKAKDRDILLPGMKPEEYAIMNQDWRSIHYADGTEEFYDSRQDPNEWENLAAKPEYGDAKAKLRVAAPSAFAKPGPSAKTLKLVIDGDQFQWQARHVSRKK
ncbi:MAG: hypothetical protein ABGX16_22725 [Pirellulales bacterium]